MPAKGAGLLIGFFRKEGPAAQAARALPPVQACKDFFFLQRASRIASFRRAEMVPAAERAVVRDGRDA